MAIDKLSQQTITAVQELWASLSTPDPSVDSGQPAPDTYASGGARRLGRTAQAIQLAQVDCAGISREAQAIFRFVEQTWNTSVTHVRSKQKLDRDEAKPMFIGFIEHALRAGIKEGEIVARHKAGFARGQIPTTDGDVLNRAILKQAKRGYRFRATPKKNLSSWPQFDGAELHQLFRATRMDFRNSLALDTSDEPGLRIEPLLRAIVRQGMSLTLHKNDHLFETRL